MGTDRRGKPLPDHLIRTIRKLYVQSGLSIRGIADATGVAKSTVERYIVQSSAEEANGRSLTQEETVRVKRFVDAQEPIEFIDSAEEIDEPGINAFRITDDLSEVNPEDEIGCAVCGADLQFKVGTKQSTVICVGEFICDGCSVREKDDPEWAKHQRQQMKAKPEDLSQYDDDPLARDL